ncbi:hypothetical protein Tsp_03965 [Trichinella spiralis]|uniref:hypothetical protein n=1 Tax=Trichinella spiralis TaxID=6334 RepID=UPI0001EFCAD7|nr:hypothetical protein Tsp_03965 [Trichinella spiralis]
MKRTGQVPRLLHKFVLYNYDNFETVISRMFHFLGKRRCENFAELKTILRYNSDLKNQNVIMIKHGKRMFSWLRMDGTCLPEIACNFLLSCYAFACVALVAVVVGVQCAVYEQQDVFTGKTDKQRANIWMKIDVEYVIIMSQYGIVKLKLFFQTRLRDEF